MGTGRHFGAQVWSGSGTPHSNFKDNNRIDRSWEERVYPVKVRIKIDGCDGSTEFDMEVDREQYKLLRLMSIRSHQVYEYGCQPIMEVNRKMENPYYHINHYGSLVNKVWVKKSKMVRIIPSNEPV